MTEEQPPLDSETPETPETSAAPVPPPDQADNDRIARLRARSTSSESTPPRFASPPPVEPASEPQQSVEPPAEAVQPSVVTPSPVPASPPPSAAPPVPPYTPPAPATPVPAAASDATPYDSPTGAESSHARWSSERPRSIVAVATAVLAATATALAALITIHLSSVNAVEDTRADVVGAATSGVATVLSYDYRHLDADFASAERLLTPRFRKQYDDTTGKGVRPLAAKYKAISSADVSAAGIVEAGSDRAVVLVFVNQTVTNSQLTAPRLDRSRIDVTLVRSHGRWLIDKLTTL